LPIIDPVARDFRIPLAAPNISSADRTAMCEAMVGTTIAYGKRVEDFEREVAELVGSRYGVATQSGTAALHLALIVSGVEADDEVLLPTLTYVAPANAVRYVGAHPVFLDVEEPYRQLDLARANAFIEREYRSAAGTLRNRQTHRRLRAILAIDLLGHPCDLEGVQQLADRWGLVVIDDAAEAFGAQLRGRPVGSHAPVSVLSFNANKLITTGGGGMLLCHDNKVAERARLLATHAKPRGSTLYVHDEVGFNYAMASAQAALGSSQLLSFEHFLTRKRAIAERYSAAFEGHPQIQIPQEAKWARASHWLYTIHIPAAHRARTMAHLKGIGIETRPMFVPMHMVRAHEGSRSDRCTVAEVLSVTGLSLPCSTRLTDPELYEVIESVLLALDVPSESGVY
jgi:perosamine synthetase